MVSGNLGDSLEIKQSNSLFFSGESSLRSSPSFDDQAWEAVFRCAPTALAFNDLQGRFIAANPSFLKLVGDYNLDELRQLCAFDLTHIDDRLDCQRHVGMLINGKKDHFEVQKRMFRKDGSMMIVRLTVSIVRDAEAVPLYLMSLTEDITEKTKAEEALRINEERLSAIIEELKAARDAAEVANATKSAFLANMSHEIRTPLSSVIGFTKLLLEERGSDLERRFYLDTVVRNGQVLMRLIDDILDLSKVEAGRMELEKVAVPFRDLLEEVLNIFRHNADKKKISLALSISVDVPLTICTDPTRLRQILINLIGNAVKFTDRGGVEVEVRLIPNPGINESREVQIIVRDTGIGISEDQKSRLFLPFSQADNSTTRKFGGTGLGLHLAKRLAHAMSGDLKLIASSIGQGSCFQFHFALEAASTQPLPSYSESELRTDLSGIRILVAEDSPDNQFLVVNLLESQGAVVQVAMNGQEAVEMVSLHDFDMILMDIQMPVMDGYEATRTLRNRGCETPIIALTAHAMLDERKKTRDAGCNMHLTKPLNPGELLQTIRDFTFDVAAEPILQ